MPLLEAICVSAERGTVKRPVPYARLRAGHGIDGDAHAGAWGRQVSLLPRESIDRVRAALPELVDGDFGENLITRGVDLQRVALGARITIGATARLEVVMVGKECHQGCAIRERTGDCIMPREGVFCRVLTGGDIRPGDRVVVEAGPRLKASAAGESEV